MFICNLSLKIKPSESYSLQMFSKWKQVGVKKCTEISKSVIYAGQQNNPSQPMVPFASPCRHRSVSARGRSPRTAGTRHTRCTVTPSLPAPSWTSLPRKAALGAQPVGRPIHLHPLRYTGLGAHQAQLTQETAPNICNYIHALPSMQAAALSVFKGLTLGDTSTFPQ